MREGKDMIITVRKKLLSMIAVIMAFAVGLTALEPSLTVNAADITFPIFDQITLNDTTKNLSVTLDAAHNSVTLGSAENLIGKGDNVSMSYHFSIANTTTDQRVSSGDTYTFTIPSQLISSGYGGLNNYSLKDSDGDEIAKVNITSAGAGTLTFSDYVNGHSDLTGTFTFNSAFNQSNIPNSTTVPVQFQVSGYATPFTINTVFSQNPPTNSKSGSAVDTNGDITWTAKLNTSGNTIPAGSSISDQLQGYQTYVPGTFKIVDVTKSSTVYDSGVSGDGGVYTTGSTPTALSTVTGTLAYTFTSGFTDSDEYDVTYKTHVTDPSQYFSGATLGNTLTFKHPGWPDQQVQASVVSVTKPNYIQKSGKYDDNGKITWTITYDNDATPADLHNVVITDQIPSGLTLDGGKLGGVGLTEDLSPASVTSGSPGYNSTGYLPASGKYSIISNGSIQTFVYNAGEVTSQQTLTLTTSIANTGYNQVNDPGYVNTAKIWASDNSYIAGGVSVTSATIGTGVNVISKSVKSAYDPATHRITWQIVVNKSGESLPAGTYVSDTIPSGLTYVPGSFTLDSASVDDGSVYSSVTSGSSTTGTLKYTFANAFSDTHTITYTTEVNDPAVYANNASKTYTNTAFLNPNDDNNTSSSTVSPTASSTTLQKAVSYDYVNRTLNWTITVNQDKTTLNNAVVKDMLNGAGISDFALDESTIQAVDSSGNPVVVSHTYDSSSKELDITLPATITDRITIKFSTKLSADAFTYFVKNHSNQNIYVSNQATMTTDTYPGGTITSNTATATINNTVAGKSGTHSYDSNVDYVDWTVQINQNAVVIQDGTISDTLSSGLTLDTSSITLYQQTLQSNGSYTNQTQVTSGYSITYDTTSGNFVLTLPTVITSPYLLTFRTYVSAGNYDKNASFSNQVTLKGTGFEQTSGSASGGTQYYGAGGTASGTRGGITILKKDATGTQVLPGAVFTLNDGFTTMTATTDSNGKASFGLLRFGTYTIRENSAPANYQLDDTPFEVTISSGTPNVTYTKTDALKTGNIKFTKLGDGGAGLSGAVFTLYPSGGTAAVSTAISGQDGQVEFKDVPYGTYDIKETTTPDGYLPLTISGVQLLDSNQAAADGTLDLDTETYNGTTVLAASARTDAPGGAITVTKVDQSNPSKTLQGAVFELFQNGTSVGTQTTDSSGVAKFTGLTSGSYTLREKTPPTTDYTTAPDYSFTISTGAPLSDRNLTATVKDAKLVGSVAFKKADASGNPLAGAEFTLTGADGYSQTATSGNDGLVGFSGVPYGDGYTITESKGIRNYSEMANPYMFNLHQSSLDLTALDPNPFVNTLKTANVWFSKTDGANALDGAVFALYADAAMTRKIQTVTSTGGTVTFTNVPYSDSPYYVQELNTPDDAHYRKAASFSFSLNDDTKEVGGGALQLTGNNTSVVSGGTSPFDAGNHVADIPLGSITVKKTDGQTGSVLQSARFQLLDAGKNVLATASTGANGLLKFSSLALNPAGDTLFYLREINSPADYALLSLDTEVILNYANNKGTLSNLDVTQPISNSLKTGSIQFTKRGSGGKALQGAVYTLYTKTAEGGKGAALASTPARPNPVISDQNGLVKFTSVPYGDYIVEETGLQSGTPAVDYTVSSAEISAELHDISGGTLTLSDVSDTIKTGTVQFTKKAPDGSNLAGATFALTGADGYSQKVISGKDGLVKFTDVPYGDYTLTETGAPADYAIVPPAKVSLHDSTTNGTGALTINDRVDAFKTGTVQFTKKAPNGSNLAGATFTLTGGTVRMTATSGQNGLVKFANVPYGDYVITETNVPANYTAVDPISVSLHDSNAAISNGILNLGNVTDALKTGNIVIHDTGNPGQVITIYDDNGNVVAVGKTDANGNVVFSNLPYGNYFARNANGQVISVTLAASTATVTLTENPYTGLSNEGFSPYLGWGAFTLALSGALLTLKRKRRNKKKD